MNSKKATEYKNLLEYVPDNWTLGKSIDFPQLIYMDFDNNKIPALQVLPDVFSNYSLETGEKILDYVFFLHQNFNTLMEEHTFLEGKLKEADIKIAELKTEKNVLKNLLKCVKEEYLRISSNIFSKLVIRPKFKELLESL